ncbi:P protein [Vibrio phage CKB-S1]|nr:P protein [Vibrio phage CKB-S1]
MSRSYTVQQGDTYETIARRMYGDEQYSQNIAESNPGAPSVPQVGSTLVVPDVPERDLNEQRANNDQGITEPDQVTLSVNDQVFRFWTDVSITQHLDAVSTVSFEAPFEPDQQQHRDAFRPYSYQPVRIDVDGDLLFTGTLVNPQPSADVRERTMTAACYSVPGVLSDCTPPASSYPLQWDNVTLQTIAAALCRPFGISVVFPQGAGQTFERIAVEPGEKVMDALARLAAQRNLVIRSDERGRLAFIRPQAEGVPVAPFTEGQSPVVRITPSFGNQQFYSHVTGITPSIVGLEGDQVTVRNQHLPGVLRPYTYTAEDMENADLQQAVQSKAGRMFAQAASYLVDVDTWRNQNGDLWRPGDFVTLEYPGAMVYSAYRLQIRSVTLRATQSERTAKLDLIIPGSLSGQVPEALPWDVSQG